MAGHQQKTGGIPVQAVDAPVYKGFIFAQKIICQPVCQCVVIISQRRVYRRVGRFIDDQQIIIFVNNGKGNRYGENIGRRNVFPQTDIEPFVFRQSVIGKYALSVQADSVLGSFQGNQQPVRIALLPQKSFDGFSGIGR